MRHAVWILAATLLSCGTAPVELIDQPTELESAVHVDACWLALFDAIGGGHPEYPGGGGNEDPAQIFLHGGSENIPVTCRAAKYWVDHDPAWFIDYFDVQAESGLPYWSHGELFSCVYTSLTTGNIIAVMKHARDRGHGALVDRASDWLRRYWAYLAMAAIDRKLTVLNGYNIHGDPLVDTGNTPGFNFGMVGTRTYVNGYGGSPMVTGNGSQHCLFNMALEHPSRTCPGNMNNSYNYYGGMRAAAMALGYHFRSDGTFDPRSKSVDPKHFGLTAAERAALTQYIQSDGRERTDEVWGMVAESQLNCPISILRTTRGVISWWGTSDGITQTCNSRKGGNWGIARFDNDGTATFVNRSSDKYGRSRYPVWRDGEQICAQSETMEEICVGLPGGSLVHELQLGRHRGVRLADEQPPPPPPPPPSSQTNDATFVHQMVPSTVAPGQSFQAQVEMRNTGDTTWTRAGGTKLGSQNPQDNRTWGTGRVQMSSNASVTNGATYLFNLTLTAPTTPGAYDFQWRMLDEGVEWFGATTPNRVITVTEGGGEPTCGDGTCDATENCSSCPADCGTCAEICGNGTCAGGETCSSCPNDCGTCAETCGNGTCGSGETCSSCPSDCGECPSAPHRLEKGEQLLPGEMLVSRDGRFELIYQGDGNLVLYWGDVPLWSSETYGTTPGKARLQQDGNFVVRDANSVALWATATNPDGDTLTLQNDGNLVLRDANSIALWSSQTGGH